MPLSVEQYEDHPPAQPLGKDSCPDLLSLNCSNPLIHLSDVQLQNEDPQAVQLALAGDVAGKDLVVKSKPFWLSFFLKIQQQI